MKIGSNLESNLGVDLGVEFRLNALDDSIYHYF